MKKEYKNPQMLVVKMETMSVLAESNPNIGVDKSGNVDAGSVESSGFFGSDSEDW